MLVGMETRVDSVSGRAVSGLSGNRVRVVLPAVPVGEASLAGLREQMRSASRAKAQAEAARAQAAAEYSRRMGERATEKTLRKQSGQSTRGVRAEVKVANQLKDLPVTRKAFEKGEISYGHTRIITAAARRVRVDEKYLVSKAKTQPVDVFSRAARQHEQQQSDDDGVSRLEAQKKMRRAWLGTDWADGMTVLHARFDPITGARVKNALSTMTNEMWREENPKDRPTTEQRLADAVARLLCDPSQSSIRKSGRSQKGTVLFVTVNYDVVTRQLRNAELVDGTPLPVETVRDLACGAEIVPAFFDTRGQPLWVGRSQRIATRAQRMALFARDRGCVGCNADPSWCQAHHIVPWQAGGPTDINNLCLLCSNCHHQIHDDGWQIRQTPGGKHIMLPPPARRNRPPPPRNHRRKHRRRTTVIRR